jgi:hypothetical protein
LVVAVTNASTTMAQRRTRPANTAALLSVMEIAEQNERGRQYQFCIEMARQSEQNCELLCD